jgi:hypothetical protein
VERLEWRQELEPCRKEVLLTVQVGDRIKVESERAGQSARGGTVEEVLGATPARLRIRWDDGRSSVLVPSAGSVQVEAAAPKPKSQRAAKPKAARPSS